MSTVDVIDVASLQNVTVPPIDVVTANDVTSNDVDGGTSAEKVKRKRTRRKPHGKKNDVKNVENESKENVVDEDIATDEPTEQNGESEKSKKKRNRKKSTNPISANELDRADQVEESQKEGVAVAEKSKKPRNPRNRNSSKPLVEKTTDDASNHYEQANEATDSQGQDGVVSEKKKKTRRPPRNKKVFKTENGSEDVDGPNAGTESQIKVSNQRTGSPAKKAFIPKPVINGANPVGGTSKPMSDNFAPQVGPSPRNNQFRGNQGQYGNQPQMRHGNSGQNRSNTPGQNKNIGNINKNMFPLHVLPEHVQYGLEQGILVEGVVRINPKNYKDAFISSPSGNTADILVSEVYNRNRALEGDLVAVSLNDQSEWRVLNENVIEMMETDETVKKIIDRYEANRGDILEGDDNDGDETDDVIVEEIIHLENGKEISRETMPKQPQQQQQQQQQRPNFVNRQNSQQRIKSLNQDRRTFSLDLVMKLPKWEQYVQRTGRVMAIMERNHSRKAAGHLEVFPDGNPNHALFRPTDNRIPRMKIPKDNCPQDFWIRSEDFKEYLFVAEIVKWDMVNFALGQLVNTLGKDSDIEARTQAILLENDVDTAEFTEEVTRSLPDLPFVISEEEIKMRRDFRSECVFTVDPLTARDLDDALSVEHLGSGRYRVGVHIADVSHFVRELTSLDHVASKRATTVYMVQTIVPMLPRLLCENLCSLNPGVDRLTFSVEWIISETGEIEKEWFGRSVIKSCVKLAYEHAQNMIDEPDRDWKEEELPPIEKAWTARDVSLKINMLQKIAVNLRKKRVDSGALRIDQPKICFQLDKETWMPKGYRLYEHRDSNRLIEEFMLLANMSVAKKLYETFPDLALLRCHPPPPEQSMQKVIKMLKPYNVPLDGTNSKTLQASFNNFRASVLAQEKEGKSKKTFGTEGRKKTKNVSDAKFSDKKGKISDKKEETSGTDKINVATGNISNAVDNLSAEVESIKLEDSSANSISSNNSDRLKKSEVARANLPDGHCVGKMSRKLYALPEPPRERLAECKFQVLMSLCAKPMKNAVYFCADNKPVHECRHYALSVDLYTHFTSPIRRYPDIMVHRLLDAALKNEKPAWLPEHVSAISSNCNKRKLIAKRVSEKSDELFLTMFVNACGPHTVNAMVLQVNDVSIDCLLLDMAVTKRVYFDELDDLKSYHFTTNKGKKIMELKWKEVIQKKPQEQPEKNGIAGTLGSTSPNGTTSTESAPLTAEVSNASGETGSAKPEVEKVFVQKLQLFSRVVLTLKEKTAFDFCAVLNSPLN